MSDFYPRNEMDLKLEAIRTEIKTASREITTELRGHNKIHEQILAQTTKTNGRVNKLEMWRWTMAGGMAVILFLFPFFMYFVSSSLSEITADVKANTISINSFK